MKAHIDVLVGDYASAVACNVRAIAADERYLAARGAVDVYAMYRMHDRHFLVFAAMLLGDRGAAVAAASALRASITDDMLRSTDLPLADLLEGFCSVRIHVYVRFGM
jgi:hypothetical protein